jgi:outer membrane murein-binding lipoprotein Lpp
MKPASGTALLALALALPAQAEEDLRAVLKALSAQVQELKSQVQQSNARVSELETEVASLRTAQRPAAIGTPGTAPALPLAASTGGNFTADAAARGGKPAVTLGDAQGSLKIPGTDTSLSFGGFVKMDTLLASVSAGRDKLGDQQLVFSQIPVGGAPGEHGQTTFHAKESRLWFRSLTPSAWGEINTYLELDLYGDPATYTYTPRLRHAYGSLGNFLAGQTWSTFLNSAVLPDHLDPNGTAGTLLPLRQPLLRWTQPFTLAGAPLEFQTALESPRSRVRNNPAADADAFNTPNADRYPDLVARLNVLPAWGNLSLAAMARQIRQTDPISGRETAAWGGAASLAGKISTVGLDNLRFMLSYGNALGRYAAINTFEDAALDQRGELRLVNTYGAMLSYQHFWTKSWRSTLSYGLGQADQPDYAGNPITRQVQSAHANLLWSPLLQTTLGMEYTFATREALDGRDGSLHRVQFSARYNF